RYCRAGCWWMTASGSTDPRPKTTGRGWSLGGTSNSPLGCRAVSAGLSAAMDAGVVMMMSASARWAWTWRRDAAEVIHWLVPSAAANRPSIDWAHFATTPWSVVLCRVRQSAINARVASDSTPPMTHRPWVLSLVAPPEDFSPRSG